MLRKAVQKHDRIALARFGHVHAQAGEIYKAVLNPVELRKRRGHNPSLTQVEGWRFLLGHIEAGYKGHVLRGSGEDYFGSSAALSSDGDAPPSTKAHPPVFFLALWP
jgi:hypothetical protein